MKKICSYARSNISRFRKSFRFKRQNKLQGETSVLVNNISYLAIIQAITYLSPLIITPFLFRTLKADAFGLFFFGNSLVFYFTILVDFGFEIYGAKEVAFLQNNPLKVNRLISSIFYLKLLFVIISLLVYYLVLTFVPIPIIAEHTDLYVVNGIQLLAVLFSCTWAYQGFQKLRTLTFINIIFKVLYIIVVLVLIKSSHDLNLLAFLYSFSALGVAVVSFVFLIKHFSVSFIRPNYIFLKSVFLKSLWFFFSRISTSIYTTSNTFILGVFAGPKAVATYSAAEKLYFAAQSLIQPINGAIIPFLAKTKSVSPIKRFIIPLLCLVAVGGIMGILLSKWFLTLFYGVTDYEMVRVFDILMIVLAITIPSILIGYPLLVALAKKDKLANVLVMYGAFLHLIILGILILTKQISPIHVAFALLATEMFLLLSRVYCLKRFKILVDEKR